MVRRDPNVPWQTFSSPDEVMTAYQFKKVQLQSEIQVRIDGKIVPTTAGRIIFSSTLPAEINFFDPDSGFYNQLMTKKSLVQLVAAAHKRCGPSKTGAMLDKISALGFEYAKLGGISICIGDMKIPETKTKDHERGHQERGQGSAPLRTGVDHQ